MANGEVNKFKGYKLYYANGMTKANARKVGMFVFGDFFFRIQCDDKTHVFKFYIHEKIAGFDSNKNPVILDVYEEVDIDYWREFWGDQFQLVFIPYIIGEKI